MIESQEPTKEWTIAGELWKVHIKIKYSINYTEVIIEK